VADEQPPTGHPSLKSHWTYSPVVLSFEVQLPSKCKVEVVGFVIGIPT
jgi:hypothetical protein